MSKTIWWILFSLAAIFAIWMFVKYNNDSAESRSLVNRNFKDGNETVTASELLKSMESH